MSFTICVGTVGAGIWYSPDGGEHFKKARMQLPFFWEIGDIQVRALAVSPHDPHRIYAGSDVGVHFSEDNGVSWEMLGLKLEGAHIWSLLLDPADPDVILAGTKPPAIFRSSDRGRTWTQLNAPLPQRCPIPIGPPRVTALAVDPRDPRKLFAGVEVGGIFHSHDGGQSWRQLPQLGPRIESGFDIHGLALSAGDCARLLVATPDGIWIKEEGGGDFTLHQFAPIGDQPNCAYTRGLALKPGTSEVIFAGVGNVVFGETGAAYRSLDGGRSWHAMRLPVAPNSTINGFAVNAADPELVVANSINGYLYLSRDGGDSWHKLAREFSEIRALAWLPN
ncbi:MAG TPA: hypothetical protein VKV28_02890 [Candidatus Binataceae bacterium]|nr:hypothetical protein [Candidatus Binataceae bacterium]